MSKQTLIKNAQIINEGQKFIGSVLIENEFIKEVQNSASNDYAKWLSSVEANQELNKVDATGLTLMPGIIDDQVHFRDPGLTVKGDLATESRSAVAGGITSFMEMPNTVPKCLTQELLQDKYDLGAEKSYCNYSFYMGAANDNFNEVIKTDPTKVCGVKIFMGASTGNMLVDEEDTLIKLFSQKDHLLTTHCEEEPVVRANTILAQNKYGESFDFKDHPLAHMEIRNHEACIASSSKAISLAQEYGAHLHILHISTAQEIEMIKQAKSTHSNITAEACVHHMFFSDEDYLQKGAFIKWNPAIKTKEDRAAICNAVKEGILDVIATDHAPHTLEEKMSDNYFTTPSGGPLAQHSLVSVLELYHQGLFSLELIASRMAHDVANLYKIDRRGYLRPGYYADLVLVDLDKPWTATKENTLYKCGWAPFEGIKFQSSVAQTWVNGQLAYDGKEVTKVDKCDRLAFNR